MIHTLITDAMYQRMLWNYIVAVAHTFLKLCEKPINADDSDVSDLRLMAVVCWRLAVEAS